MEKYHQHTNSSMASTPAHARVSAEPIQRLANSYGIANLMVHLNATHEARSIEQEYQAYITEYQGEGVIPILPYWKVSLQIDHLS